jgi:hypothetical protein
MEFGGPATGGKLPLSFVEAQPTHARRGGRNIDNSAASILQNPAADHYIDNACSL